jgi:hypothetical protein
MSTSRLFGVALALTVLSGCGGGSSGVAVSGKVTFNGKPVKEGSISFIPVEGTNGPTAGTSISDGSFSIGREGGPVPGKYRVEINSYEDIRPATDKELAGALFGRSAESFKDAPKQMARKNVVPPRYNETSELTATIPTAASFEVNYSLTK